MTPRTNITRSIRIFSGAFLTTAAVLAGWHQLSAQPISSHNSDAPVDYAADRIELQGRQDRVVLSGNVDIKQGKLRLRADRTNVAFTSEGSLKIQRIIATGGALVTRGDEVAHGNIAIYDFNRRIITMVGNASLKRGGDTLYGKRFVIDLNSGVSSADGRVSGTFSVPDGN